MKIVCRSCEWIEDNAHIPTSCPNCNGQMDGLHADDGEDPYLLSGDHIQASSASSPGCQEPVSRALANEHGGTPLKLMTRELETSFHQQGSTADKHETEVVVIAHYFSSSWDWWATEYDSERRIFFGLVRGFEVELGYFSLDELEENSCNIRPFGGIERDPHWSPRSLATVRQVLKEATYGR